LLIVDLRVILTQARSIKITVQSKPVCVV